MLNFENIHQNQSGFENSGNTYLLVFVPVLRISFIFKLPVIPGFINAAYQCVVKVIQMYATNFKGTTE